MRVVALEETLAREVEIDPTFETEYVWQMERREEGGIMAAFRVVRLPRPLRAVPPQQPPLTPGVGASWALEDEQGMALALCTATQAWGLGWVERLAVAPERRRRGLGTALLEEARAWARVQGLRGLTVALHPKNHPAISFFQRSGFVFGGFHDRWFEKEVALFFTHALGG